MLAGAPETTAVGDLRLQTLSQVAHADNKPTRKAQIAFAKKVERLRWSNPTLTYYIRGSAEEARANAELAIPDICSEARTIAAGGYQTVPSDMALYERREQAANNKVSYEVKPHEKGLGSLHDIILRMLKPYEHPDEKALIPREPSKKQVEQILKVWFSYAFELIGALGLPTKTLK